MLVKDFLNRASSGSYKGTNFQTHFKEIFELIVQTYPLPLHFALGLFFRFCPTLLNALYVVVVASKATKITHFYNTFILA